jgi:hypothetical protein
MGYATLRQTLFNILNCLSFKECSQNSSSMMVQMCFPREREILSIISKMIETARYWNSQKESKQTFLFFGDEPLAE